MLVSEKAYFVDVPKSASTYVYQALRLIVDQTWPSAWTTSKHHPKQFRHGCLHDDRHGRLIGYNEEEFADKLVYVAARDPVEYYLSIFHYEREDFGPIKKELQKEPDYQNYFDWWTHSVIDNRKPLADYESPRYKNRPQGLGLCTFRFLDNVDDRFFAQGPRTWEEVEQWYDEHYWNPDCPMEMLGPHNIGKDFADLVLRYEDKFLLLPDWKDHIPTFHNNILQRPRMHHAGRKSVLSYYPGIQDVIKEAERIIYRGLDFTSEW